MLTPLEQKVTEQVEQWKKQLLDLTRRNRLLNFKPTPRSTITVVDEMPAEVYRALWLEKQVLRFQPTDKAAETTAGDEAGAPFAGYEPGQLAARHRDDRLQTRLDRSQLERSLRYIQQQARSAMDEQGVGTLFLALGMLYFRPEAQSEEVQRAPVLLLEVELESPGRNRLPTLAATDEDPIVNPTLAEYLRRNFDLALPDQDEITDPIQFFAAVQAAIARMPGWELRDEIHLGLFAFQKLVMFKDLERNLSAFAANALALRLCDPSDGVPPGVPAEVAALDLDEALPPEAANVVMDADASQMRTLAAVGMGHDLVIEGPPGTGKSQTIANLVAQSIGAGKSVLFVSEKMAALDVVFTRLKDAGLGDFCFELHSQKARRGAAIADLARSWQAALQPSPAAAASSERLVATRQVLTAYAHELHAPFGALAWSPFQAIGELERVREAPAWRWPGSAREVDERRMQDALAALAAWAATAVPVGDPRAHAWGATQCDYYSGGALEDLARQLGELLAELGAWSAAAAAAAAALPLGPLRTTGDVATAAAYAGLLGRCPGVEPGPLAHPAWSDPSARLPEDLVAAVREAAKLHAEASARFVPEALQAPLEAGIALVRGRHRSWHRMLHRDYREVRATWLAWRRPGYAPALGEQADHLEQVVKLQASAAFLAAHDAEAAALFGSRWHGEASDAGALAALAAWLREFRAFGAAHALGAEALQLAAAPPAVADAIGTLVERTTRCAALAEALFETTRWSPRDAVEEPDHVPVQGSASRSLSLPLLAERLAGLQREFGRAAEWCAFLRARAVASQSAGAEIVAAAMTAALPFPALAAAWRRAFLRRWLDEAVAERTRLREFDSAIHERGIAEFRELDRQVHVLNRERITAALRRHAQEALARPELAPQVGLLRREIGRRARYQPIRRTIAQAFDAIRAIKPCFLMSPLTVAQCLDPAKHVFDVVIFDEASQLTPEDAIGAIIRGRQLVVTGDQKQLPPTNFFTIQTEQSDGNGETDPTLALDDSESILELCQRSSFPSSTLRWHYRSRHESLITFSNQSFYDGSLLTFPSADTDCSVRGLRFEFVEDGRYEGSGENPREAARVVDAIAAHAALYAARPENCPTLGVGTFNVRQQSLILDLLAERRKSDAALDEYLGRDKEHGFFVKNLENIQGDDRDHIFLSVTYGRNEQGRVRLNFGPINGENGWRRLNVLVTRARSVMRVFASMRADDIDTATETLGVKLLRKFLRYAETGVLEDRKDDAAAQVESPFEGQVRLALEARGYRVIPQVGAAGYRIDLAVQDPSLPGRYVCGIECDGASYHSSETARDRDRLRQQILEDLGWRIHRVWSTDWFKDRVRALDRICALIEDSRRRGDPLPPAPRPAASGPVPAAVPAPAPAAPPAPSALPPAAPYEPARLAAGSGDFYTVPLDALGRQAVAVVECEGPVHEWDVTVRIADAWGLQRVGSQIEARIAEAIGAACGTGRLVSSGGFLSRPAAAVRVRSREGTNIPMERVAPAEIQAAIREALAALGAAGRDELIAAVRGQFGFQRTGARIESWIGESIQALVSARVIGEGPHGLCLLS